jgi:hypothetical protein
MARSFLTAINLNKNEIQNAVAQNLAAAPSSPAKGQFYYNSTGGDDTLYWWNGSQWMAAKSAAGATPAATVTNEAMGDVPVVGVSTNFAREDHKHGMPPFGVSTATTTFGLTKTDGVSAGVARGDHTHGTPAHDAAAHGSIPLSSLQAPFGPAVADTAFGSSVNNGVSSSAARADHIHGNPVHDAAAHASISISSLAAPVGDLNMGGYKVTNIGAPTSGTDAANKTYVDNATAGLTWKTAVRLASPPATNFGTLSGLIAVDGVTPVAGDRILLKSQATPANNGIYIAAVGAWTRATDADSSAELVDAAVFVSEGTVNADTAWVQTADAPITVGTTAIAWVQFAGGGAVVGGAGLAQSGNTLNVVAANGSIVVGADDVQVGYSGSGGETGTAVTAARSDHNHDSKYVDVAGDTMTNTLTISKNLGIGLDASASTVRAATFVALNGGLTGNSVNLSGSGATLSVGGSFSVVDFSNVAQPVTLPNITPVAATDAATKAYVDARDALKPSKFSALVAAAVSTLINHALNTRDVLVNVYRVASPYDTIECDVERTDVNNVTVRFAVAPAAGEYRVVVMG